MEDTIDTSSEQSLLDTGADSTNAAAPAASETTTTTTQPSTPSTGWVNPDGTFGDKWLDALPDDVADYKNSFKNFKSVPDMAKALANANALIGKRGSDCVPSARGSSAEQRLPHEGRLRTSRDSGSEPRSAANPAVRGTLSRRSVPRCDAPWSDTRRTPPGRITTAPSNLAKDAATDDAVYTSLMFPVDI